MDAPITIERLNPSIAMFSSAHGGYTHYADFAAGPRTLMISETRPAPQQDVWLLCQVFNSPFPEVLRYDGKNFRSPSGALKTKLLWWSYIITKETTTPDNQVATPPESRGDWLYDTMRIIAKYHKIVDVRNVMDMIPWPNDVEGEPEQ